MSCTDAERLLGPYADGELRADQRQDLETHLRECLACSALLRELADQNAALGGLGDNQPEPPTRMKRSLWRRLRRRAVLGFGRIFIFIVAVGVAAAFLPGVIARDLPPSARVLFGLSGLAFFAALGPLVWRAWWDVKNVVWFRFVEKEDER